MDDVDQLKRGFFGGLRRRQGKAGREENKVEAVEEGLPVSACSDLPGHDFRNEIIVVLFIFDVSLATGQHLLNHEALFEIGFDQQA